MIGFTISFKTDVPIRIDIKFPYAVKWHVDWKGQPYGMFG